MSSIPPFHQDPESVRLTDREVVAMADLHRRLMETKQAGPSLLDVAQMLGITEYEARALLAQVRKDSDLVAPPSVATSPRKRSGLTASFIAAFIGTLVICLFLSMRQASPSTATAESPAVGTTAAEEPVRAQEIQTLRSCCVYI